MPNFSSVVVSGHLGRDAELKDFDGSKICKFSVAVTTKKKDGDSTAWYECSIFGPRGERLHQHLVKGCAVIVGGELVPRRYKGKNDELRTSLDINVQSFSFAGAKGEQIPAPSKRTEPDDDSIPF